jgi:hypothetical protein
MTSLSKPRITTIVLIAILILAVVTRIGWPGLTEFKYDEAQMYRSAVLLVREGKIPVDVESSLGGLPYPPLMTYILAIPLIFIRQPAADVIFLGVLGAGAVGLTYTLAARYYNARVGLVSAALFAAAPWAIFYSRKVWAQNIPLLTLLMMLGLYAFVIKRRLGGITAAAIVAILLTCIHLGNAVLLVIVGLVMLLYPKALKESFLASSVQTRLSIFGATIIALLLMLGLTFPWLQNIVTGEMAGGFSELVSVNEKDSGFQPLEEIQLSLMIATGNHFSALSGDQQQFYEASLPLPPQLALLDQIEVWLLAAGAIYVFLRAAYSVRRHQAHPGGAIPYVVLAIWLAVPIVVWTLVRFQPQPHRYIALYPAPFLALALLIDHGLAWITLKQGMRAARAVGGVLAVALIGLMTWQMVTYFTLLRVVDRTIINYGHGPAAELVWNAAREARRLAEPGNLPIVINSTGDDPETEGEAAAFDALLGDMDLRLIEGEAVTLSTQDGFVQVYTRANADYAIDVVPPADTSGEAVAQIENGIEFLRVELGRDIEPGRRVPFSVVWRVWGLPPTYDDYSYSVQLFDQDWLRYENINDHFLRTRNWHIGDLVLTSGVMRVPDNAPANATYHLVLTLYMLDTAGNITPVSVIDIAGNPAGEFIVVPLD